MSTRRSLFVFGALLVAVLVPAMSLAQTTAPTATVGGVSAARIAGSYDSLDVEWTAVPQLTDTTNTAYPLSGYRVYYREGADVIDETNDLVSLDYSGGYINVSGLDKKTAVLSGLKAGTLYQVAVVVTNSFGRGGIANDGSSADSATVTEAPALTAPTLTVKAGDGSIDASWTAVSTADSYKLTWSPKDNGVTSTATTAQTMYTIPRLANGTTYEVTVMAMRGTTEGPASDTEEATPKAASTTPTPPTTSVDPTKVNAAPAGSTSITIEWEAPTAPVAAYHVAWMESNNATANIAANPPNRHVISPNFDSYTIGGLKASTSYRVAVRGVEYGTSLAGDWQYAVGLVTTDAVGTPGTPMGVSAKSGDKMVTVSWERVSGATGYRVQYRTAAESYSTTVRMKEVTGTSAEITGLTNGTEYMFKVSAKNAAGYGDASMEVKQTPKAAAGEGKPRPPRNVKLTPMGRDQIKVEWAPGIKADNTDDATRIRYDIGYTDVAGTMFSASLAPQTILPVPGGAGGPRNATSHTLTLEVDKSYLIAVRAVAGDGTGTVSALGDWVYRTVSREMTPAAPRVPLGVQVTAGDGSLMVSWRKRDEAKSYLVEWRGKNQGYDHPERQEWVAQPASGDSVSVTIDEGVVNGTEYFVQVKTYNERGGTKTRGALEAASGASEEARATPMAGKLAAPNPVEVMPGDGQVTVTWTSVTGAAKYRIQWRTAAQSYNSTRQAEGFYQRSSGALEHEHTVDGLENGTQYMFRVFAVDADGMMSDPSDEVSTTPMVPTPALPVFGALVLGAGLVAAGRRRLRARRLLKA